MSSETETNLRKLLKDQLENLEEKSFKSFKHSLGHCTVPKGCKKIPRMSWEQADVLDLVDLIVRRYTTEHAPQVVFTVLEDIGEMKVRLDLARGLQKSKNRIINHNKCLD
ncbi:hypothetical protein XELAEV_18001549mg [Xenopus laevis]|nr:hypothetical protein XELAEV_18001549mg [Xenopus laevis]